ncbi:MAG: glycosyltransferase [Bacteroidales bacterium]|jgi:glycosyltransferase involved in cell wall biosynthesis|nr:glycosyltransferase [Bacteroidales bacterium]MDI9534050.1 glycosyltransferase [Bacteroidota bacterium]MBP7036019.1 glycosyltransferase [Bacteroidales bacterium]HHU98384.1 glycosyltransferase family 4 protein [Bacteroidales bacterium]HPK84086.1 glycosyltransferase [Bacteroidales bacterium]
MRAVPAKVLIITYYWPPSGGAGVQRWLKFTKYLPSSGWFPEVLTVDPLYAAYPFRDDSLYGEVPVDVKVHRTKALNFFALYNRDQSKIPHAGFASGKDKGFKSTVSRFIRGNFFIPDPRRGWNRFAFRRASELIRSQNITHIITTSPPHSTQLIGLRLKRRFPGLKWVADLRDPWTDIYYYDMFRPSLPARMLDRNLEKRVLSRADRIITVGKTLASLLAAKTEAVAGKTEILPNGFDEEDFQGIVSSVPERFTITYVGTLSPAYPVRGFIDAVKDMRINGKQVALQFVGTVPEEIRALFPAGDEGDGPRFISYCEHPEAIRYMMSSSLLLLIIPDHSSNRSILTGKIFEYLATEKPILFLGPEDGDAARLLTLCGYQGIFGYDDVEGIREFILRVAEGKPVKRSGYHLEYSRRALAVKLGNILDRL